MRFKSIFYDPLVTTRQAVWPLFRIFQFSNLPRARIIWLNWTDFNWFKWSIGGIGFRHFSGFKIADFLFWFAIELLWFFFVVGPLDRWTVPGQWR